MQFSSGLVPPVDAYIRADFKVLREMLRLPKSIEIIGVRPHPADPRACLIDIRGDLPGEGELLARYETLDTTVVTFAGFTR